MTILISSRENAQYKRLRKIAASARERRKAGRVLLDGAHLTAAAMMAGHAPELLAVSQKAADNREIADLLHRADKAQLIVVADVLFAEISPVETPTGLIALIETPICTVPEHPDFCVCLEDIQDPGNLGSILRSAAAAGVQVAWLSPGCCDAWSPKVLRGGMGAHFALQICERANIEGFLGSFEGLSLATSLKAEKSLYEVDLTGPMSLLLGNEGAGLSASLQSMARETVSIPMPGNIESLNVAAAAAVCLFERVRQQKV